MHNKEVLTQKQEQIYAFVKKRLSSKGEAPTRAEIAEAVGGKSIKTINQHLAALQRKGLILINRYAQRGISLVEDEKATDELIQVPVFASAGCGDPSILADRTFDEYVMVSADMMNGKKDELFVIRAVGSSMMDAGIRSGDLVLVRKTDDVRTGDKVVAIIEDTAVIKKIEFMEKGIILRPMSTDPQYRAIILKDDSKIFGKVIEVLKMERTSEFEYHYDNPKVDNIEDLYD